MKNAVWQTLPGDRQEDQKGQEQSLGSCVGACVGLNRQGTLGSPLILQCTIDMDENRRFMDEK